VKLVMANMTKYTLVIIPLEWSCIHPFLKYFLRKLPIENCEYVPAANLRWRYTSQTLEFH
jgi:hypothetical protein